jgi:hypothetical protein
MRRETLDDWVYGERRLLNSFDPAMVQSHAVAQLARALNTRRLIAVVGSGISNGYGLPSWTDLLVSANAMVAERRRKLEDDLSAALNADDPSTARNLANFKDDPTHKTFDEMVDRVAVHGYDASSLPTAFEISENLYVSVVLAELETAREPFSRRLKIRQARKTFRDRLKWQVQDERGRAEILLNGLLLAANGEGDDALKALKVLRDRLRFPGARADCEIGQTKEDEFATWFSHLLYAQIGAQGKRPCIRTGAGLLETKLKRHGSSLAGLLTEWLDKSAEDGPDHRHLVDAGMRLLSLEEAMEVLSPLATLADDKIRNRVGLQTLFADRAMTPKHRDPFAVLMDDLKIKRYLTTNYDGEIDRLLEARGYRQVSGRSAELDQSRDRTGLGAPPASRTLMLDAASNRAEVLSYEPGAAAFLFDYGADTREQRVQVLHIHGRARSETSWMVLTEQDYRERYVNDDDPRTRSDDAMRLIFTANPLLFVGLGMQEPDILRPLRAFSGDVSRLCDRPAIALLPRDTDEKSLRQRQAQALSQYGVYNLYYGTVTTAAPSPENPEGVLAQPDYMARILKFQDTFWNVLYKPQDDVALDLAKLKALEDKFFEDTILTVEGGSGAVTAVRQVVAQVRAVHRQLLAFLKRMIPTDEKRPGSIWAYAQDSSGNSRLRCEKPSKLD